jgi:hypothetical protein
LPCSAPPAAAAIAPALAGHAAARVHDPATASRRARRRARAALLGRRDRLAVCVGRRDLDVDELPEQLREEIAHFFVSYKRREDHEVEEDGWEGRDAAERVIDEVRSPTAS